MTSKVKTVAKKPVKAAKKALPKHPHHRRSILLAFLAGLFLIASGVASTSVLLTGLQFADRYVGLNAGAAGEFFLQVAQNVLTFVVGFGGFLDFTGAILLWRNHGSFGRFLIGLGGGTAVFGLLFSVVEALRVSGLAAPFFVSPSFFLYWIGCILATASIFFSRKAPATKPLI